MKCHQITHRYALPPHSALMFIALSFWSPLHALLTISFRASYFLWSDYYEPNVSRATYLHLLFIIDD